MKRVGVVTHRHEQVALGIKRQRTADVAALLALRADIDDRLFAFEIELVALEREPAHADDTLLFALVVLGRLR